MMSDRMLYVHLAEGVAIIAARVMPNPHKYTITARGEMHELSVERAQELVDAKTIVGAPCDALWDRIMFRVVDRDCVANVAFQYLPNGWGYCEWCGEMMEPSKKHEKPTAPRHGHSFGIVEGKKKEIRPPCGGSLAPLLDAVIPEKSGNVAA